MKAGRLLKYNIETLLKARGQTQHELARYCHRTDGWLSKILSESGGEDRELPLKYLDRIADFFGIATYQLFQPGISPLTERRVSSDRRTGRDRRISQALPHRGREIDLFEVIRALPREDQDDLLADAADRLNKRLKRRPSAATARAALDRTDETSAAAHVPATVRRKRQDAAR